MSCPLREPHSQGFGTANPLYWIGRGHGLPVSVRFSILWKRILPKCLERSMWKKIQSFGFVSKIIHLTHNYSANKMADGNVLRNKVLQLIESTIFVLIQIYSWDKEASKFQMFILSWVFQSLFPTALISYILKTSCSLSLLFT